MDSKIGTCKCAYVDIPENENRLVVRCVRFVYKNPENEDEVIAPITSGEVCSVCREYEPFVEDTENPDDSEIEFETL